MIRRSPEPRANHQQDPSGAKGPARFPAAGARRAAAVGCAAALALASVLAVREGGSQPKPGATVPKAPPIQKQRPSCVVTGVSPTFGPPGTLVAVTANDFVNCKAALKCGLEGWITACSKTQSGCTITAPTMPALPVACQVVAFRADTDPTRQQLTGKAFTVTATQSGDCQATSVTPTAATPASLITISGIRMDQNCLVSFQGPFASGSMAVRSASATSLQAQIPPWPPGLGALRVASSTRPDVLAEQWFQILPRITGQECEAYEVSPAVGKPGDKVYVYGTAMDRDCSVRFIDARGVSYPVVNPIYVDYYRQRVQVPNMPLGAAKVYSDREDATHMKLNAVPFQVTQ